MVLNADTMETCTELNRPMGQRMRWKIQHGFQSFPNDDRDDE